MTADQPTSPLDTGHLTKLVASLQSPFGWPQRSDDYTLASTWVRERSGSSFFHLTGRPNGPDVVVKTVKGWSHQDAQAHYEAMADLARIIEEAGLDDAGGIRPLAWSPVPSMLVMPYVEGLDMVSILRQPAHPAWKGELESWMGRAGAMLAIFHRRHHTQPRDDISAAANEARDLAQRLRLDASVVELLLELVDWRHRCSGSFGDFGPGNLHATPEGRLYLLDPPDAPVTALIHRDLANFLFELRRQLAGRGFTRHRAIPGHIDRFRRAFLDGYSAHHQEGSLAAPDEGLIALFEMRRSVGMARKRFPRRPGDAIWFARSALARRREVLRAGGQS